MKMIFDKIITFFKSTALIGIIFISISCEAFAKENVPYIASGNFVMEENIAEYEVCGVDLYFLNKSEKKVRNFTVVFYLFDEEGEPVNTTKNNIVITIDENLNPMEEINLCISLDKYMNYLPEEGYFIDYLYVSNIVYEDSSVWSDPFGMHVF